MRRMGLLLSLLLLAVLPASTAAAEFSFAVLGDRTGKAQQGIYEHVWHEVGEARPAFILTVGDTIEGNNTLEQAGREWDGIDATKLPYADLPLYQVPGNHDVWNDASAALYRQRTGRELHYSFVHEGALFVILDNSRSDELAETEYAFLEQSLAANANAEPKFVLYHRPNWLGYVLTNRADHRLHRLCKQYGVDYVITGHLHRLVRFAFDGVEYVIAGSSGGSLDHRQAGSPPDFAGGGLYGHLWVTVRDGRAAVEMRELGGAWGGGRRFDLARWAGLGPGADLK